MLRDSPRIPVRQLVAATACIALQGCYYTHLASGQLEMNRRREPIEEVIARPETDDVLRRRLELAVRAREFAMSELGLPDNGSYRTFADLGRRYATWNLFAAPEFSVEPKRWCFPVAGCVSYRGYFDEQRAAREAAIHRERGFDVHVGPSIAYSTLGHLRDPVLNTMLGYGNAELAAFIFHELAHQAAYAPGDSDFNEAFATVVETEGLRRWFEQVSHPAEFEKFLTQREKQNAAAALMIEARDRLAGLYESGIAEESMRAAKAAEFTRLRESLAFGGFSTKGDFNNARLVAVATYERCVPALRAELDRLDNDLPVFYSAMNLLVHDPAARNRLCPPPWSNTGKAIRRRERGGGVVPPLAAPVRSGIWGGLR
jgi:predicted aminopeptidase